MNGRLRTLISRAVLRLVDDSKAQQRLQISILKDEVKSDVQRFQQYGFSSHPLPGAQVIVLCPGGDRDHPIALAVDDAKYRPKDMQPGEVALYHQAGNCIILRNDGKVEIVTDELVVTAANKVTFDTPLVACTGTITQGAGA